MSRFIRRRVTIAMRVRTSPFHRSSSVGIGTKGTKLFGQPVGSESFFLGSESFFLGSEPFLVGSKPFFLGSESLTDNPTSEIDIGRERLTIGTKDLQAGVGEVESDTQTWTDPAVQLVDLGQRVTDSPPTFDQFRVGVDQVYSSTPNRS